MYEYALGLAFSRQRKATQDFRQAVLMAILNEVPPEGQHSLIPTEEIRRVVDLGCAIANGGSPPRTWAAGTCAPHGQC